MFFEFIYITVLKYYMKQQEEKLFIKNMSIL